MGGSALRAETAGGRSYGSPSDALLLRLLGELDAGNRFLIVDRLDAANDQHYMQVYREADGTFAMEYRAGGADRHFEAVSADLRQVHAVLTGWAADLPGWRDVCHWHHWPVP
jgi:tRNA A37 threonylcarbamoyladenosine modification protein TsaB